LGELVPPHPLRASPLGEVAAKPTEGCTYRLRVKGEGLLFLATYFASQAEETRSVCVN